MGLRKHTNLASYALGNVLKYRTRSVAILLALIFSTALLCSTEFIREGLVTDIEDSLEEGPDIIVQRLQAGRQASIPLDWSSDLTEIHGVRLATPRVWGYADIGQGRILTIMGVNSTDYTSVTENLGTNIQAGGRFIQESDVRKMVVGQGIIDLMSAAGVPISVGVGANISLIAYNGSLVEFQIVGIFTSDAKIFNYDLILTDIESARLLFGLDNDSCTDFALWIDYGAYMNDVALRIDNGFPEARVLTRVAINDITLRTYNNRAGIVSLLWTIVLMTVIILAFTTSSAGSDEARREVGLLKALGFDTVDVLEIRALESLTLSILGASLGISFAIIYDFILGAPGLSGYLLGWNLVLLNQGIPLSISITTIFLVYTVALVPILVATVIPSWRNAITEPDIVLRGV